MAKIYKWVSMVVSSKRPTMAAIQRVFVLNQRRRRPRSRLVHVNFSIRQNLSPFDILPDVAILKKNNNLPPKTTHYGAAGPSQTCACQANAAEFCFKPWSPAACSAKVFCYRKLHLGRGRGLRLKQDLGVEVRPHCHQRPFAPCQGLHPGNSDCKVPYH